MSTVYVRNKEIFNYYDTFFDTRLYFGRFSHNNFSISRFFICFCGKIYTGLKLILNSEKVSYVYSIKEFIQVCNDWGIDHTLYIEKNKRKYVYFARITNEFFKIYHGRDDIFLKANAPIICFEQDIEPYKNVMLKNYNFFRVVDANTAFQEINMYLNGILCKNNEKEPLPITDIEKRNAHGFNENSFRNTK